MLFKNNLTPAFAYAGYQESKSESSSKKDGVSFATAESDFESYSSNSNGAAKRRAPQNSAPQKGAPQRKNEHKAPKSSRNFMPIVFAIIAIIAIVIVIAIVVSIANAPGSNMKKSDTVYTSFQDANGSWRIAVDGEVLEDIVFTNEIDLEVAANNTFAYIFEHLEDGTQKIHILQDDEIESTSRDGQAKEILAKSPLTPCVIYRNTDFSNNSFCFKGENNDNTVTLDVNADNFVIVPDGSAIYFTIPAADENTFSLQRYKNATCNTIANGFIPLATSAEGDYVYVTTSSQKGFAYFDMTDEDEFTFSQVQGINDNIYVSDAIKGITAINVDGDQVILATTKGDGSISSWFYEIGDDSATSIGLGIFTSCHFDPEVLFEDSLLDSYFEVDNSYAPQIDDGEEEDDEEEDTDNTDTSVSPKATCFLNSKKECLNVANTQGKFSPDGKYFYYIDATVTKRLKRVALSSKKFDKHEDMPPIGTAVDFYVTQKGDLYILINETKTEGILSLYFVDSSTSPEAITLSSKVDEGSVSLAVSTLYFTETATDEASGTLATAVYATTDGSKPALAEFEDYSPTLAPEINMGAGKQGYAKFSADEGDKLFYTSNGKSFDFLCDALPSASQTN